MSITGTGAAIGAATTEKVHISITDVKNMLQQGVVRCRGDKGYNEELGSVQEKYGLNKSQTGRLFKHPKLAGLRVNIQREELFEIIDDTVTEATEELITTANTSETSEQPNTPETVEETQSNSSILDINDFGPSSEEEEEEVHYDGETTANAVESITFTDNPIINTTTSEY